MNATQSGPRCLICRRSRPRKGVTCAKCERKKRVLHLVEPCGGKRSLLCREAECRHNTAHVGKYERSTGRAYVCAIVAAYELGPMVLDEVACIMGMTLEGARVAEKKALAKMAAAGIHLGEHLK